MPNCLRRAAGEAEDTGGVGERERTTRNATLTFTTRIVSPIYLPDIAVASSTTVCFDHFPGDCLYFCVLFLLLFLSFFRSFLLLFVVVVVVVVVCFDFSRLIYC